MNSLNQVMFIGNVSRDSVLRKTPQGSNVANIELVIDSATHQDKKTYVNVTAWDKLAESLAERAHKGSRILVSGRLTTDIPRGEERNRGSLIVTANSFANLNN